VISLTPTLKNTPLSSADFVPDGKAFEVVDGKLYVNKNLDVYEVWAEDKAENISTGEKEWPAIEQVPAADL